MLTKYKNDPLIMVINGSNFLDRVLQHSNAYFLSKFAHFWGWATWKRAWEKYDASMADWSQLKNNPSFLNTFTSVWERWYFTILFDATYKDKTNSWGYKWLYSIWKNGGRGITPGVNLVKNIGFTKEATHKFIRKFEFESTPISGSVKLIDRHDFDRLTAKKYYAISPLMVLAQWLYYSKLCAWLRKR